MWHFQYSIPGCLFVSLASLFTFVLISSLFLVYRVNCRPSRIRKTSTDNTVWSENAKGKSFSQICHLIRHIEKLQWLVFSFFITITLLVLRIFFSFEGTITNCSMDNLFLKSGFLLIWSFLLPISYTRLNNSAYVFAGKLDNYNFTDYPSPDLLYSHENTGYKRHWRSPLDIIFWGTTLIFIAAFSYLTCRHIDLYIFSQTCSLSG